MSPGLCYLEQVCQMLEEIARKQMRSRAIQTEMDALREHENMELSQVKDIHVFAMQLRKLSTDWVSMIYKHEMSLSSWWWQDVSLQPYELTIVYPFTWLFQAVDTCQTPDFKAAAEEDLSSYQTPDFKAAAEENLSSYQSLENTQSAEQSPTEPQQRKDSSSRHFRQRSASDTNISTMHLSEHLFLSMWSCSVYSIYSCVYCCYNIACCVCDWCRKVECKLQRAASEYRWPAGEGRGRAWEAGRIHLNTIHDMYCTLKNKCIMSFAVLKEICYFFLIIFY